jgi:hypothetical protein
MRLVCLLNCRGIENPFHSSKLMEIQARSQRSLSLPDYAQFLQNVANTNKRQTFSIFWPNKPNQMSTQQKPQTMPRRPVNTKFVAALLLSLVALSWPWRCLAQKHEVPNLALSLSPGDPPQMYAESRREIAYCNGAIRLNCQDASLYMRRAKAYNRISQFKPAMQDFDRALSKRVGTEGPGRVQAAQLRRKIMSGGRL